VLVLDARVFRRAVHPEHGLQADWSRALRRAGRQRGQCRLRRRGRGRGGDERANGRLLIAESTRVASPRRERGINRQNAKTPEEERELGLPLSDGWRRWRSPGLANSDSLVDRPLKPLA